MTNIFNFFFCPPLIFPPIGDMDTSSESEDIMMLHNVIRHIGHLKADLQILAAQQEATLHYFDRISKVTTVTLLLVALSFFWQLIYSSP